MEDLTRIWPSCSFYGADPTRKGQWFVSHGNDTARKRQPLLNKQDFNMLVKHLRSLEDCGPKPAKRFALFKQIALFDFKKSLSLCAQSSSAGAGSSGSCSSSCAISSCSASTEERRAAEINSSPEGTFISLIPACVRRLTSTSAT